MTENCSRSLETDSFKVNDSCALLMYDNNTSDITDVEAIRVTNELMKSQNLSEEELYHNSMLNMIEKEKSLLTPMIKIIMNLKFGIGITSEGKVITKDDFSGGEFIVLSNDYGIGGSRQMLNISTLKKASEIAESDLYILPSSIHEVLLISVNEINSSPSELKNRVSEVNLSEVSEEERLTDNVYIFKKDTSTIEIA